MFDLPLFLMRTAMLWVAMLWWGMPNGWSQTESAAPWWQDGPAPEVLPGQALIRPTHARPIAIEPTSLQQALRTPPTAAAPVLAMPWPDGSVRHFRMEPAPVMAPALAARYPDIQAWRGRGLEDPQATLRLSVSPWGVHGMVLNAEGQVFLDPATHSPQKPHPWHQVYFRNDLSPWQAWACAIQDSGQAERSQQASALAFGGELRTYRTAVAANGEYSQFHGGTKLQVLSAIVNVINRVNGIYARDAGITLQLIPENDTLIFLDPSTDPLSNNTFSLFVEIQDVIDSLIGTPNYDVGHVFSTGGGGVANFESVCAPTEKAQGVTGLPNPVGDPFAIDFVAHEFGHQFGADHTFNGTSGACGGQRVGGSAYEPGSGTTIMGYAGICPGQNLQSNSDAHFHARSIVQMHNFTRNGGAAGCGTISTIVNQPPQTQARYDGLVLPFNTPFRLLGTAVDPEQDPLLYCWEQYDLGPPSPPGSPSFDAPIIRSRPPVDTGYRLIPRIGRLVTNTFDLGEILPTYARNLTFRLTVRDQQLAGAGVDMVEVNYAVTEQAGPFVVLSPNSNLNWQAGTFEEVRWEVANTDLPPVNAQAVDILLSTDGGLTYPVILADSVPNDGQHTVVVPDLPGNQCRVMVAAADHIFLDISDANFTITAAPGPGFDLLALRDVGTICAGDSVRYSWLSTAFGGFANSLVVTPVGNVPPGLHLRTEPSPLLVGDSLRIVARIDSPLTTPALYSFALQLSGGGVSETVPVELRYLPGPPSPPQPLAPVSGQAGRSRRPTFQWQPAPGADAYRLQIGLRPDLIGGQVFASLDTSFFTLPQLLLADTVYYWAVASDNTCGSGPFSPTRVLRTGACDTVSNQDGPLQISPIASPAQVVSTVGLPQPVIVGDVNVWDIRGSHPAMNELSIRLRQANGNHEVELYAPVCGPDDAGFRLHFDDEAATTVVCPPVSDQPAQPVDGLSTFLGQPSGLNWELVVQDNVLQQGGTLRRWTLEMCAATPTAPTLVNQSLAVANAGARQIDNASLAASLPEAIATELTYTLYQLPTNGNLRLDSATLILGDTFTQADIDLGRLSYQHNGSLTLADSFAFNLQGPNGAWLGGQRKPINIWAVGIDASIALDWAVYPNPARTHLTVALPRPLRAGEVLVLRDVHGRILRKWPANQPQGTTWTFSVQGLSAGLYLLSLHGAGLRATRRVQVQP